MKNLILLFTFCLFASCNNTAVKKATSFLNPEPEIIEVEVEIDRSGEPSTKHVSKWINSPTYKHEPCKCIMSAFN